MSFSLPEDAVELLQTMVSIDSVNSAISGKPEAEAELVNFIDRLVTSWGWTSRRLPVPEGGCNLLVFPPVRRPETPWLLFDSHLDTVSIAGMAAPFDPKIENGKLHGRGSCDTKGSGAAMLWALKAYAARFERRNDVAIIFSSDEEIGKSGVRRFVRHDLGALERPISGVIVGEPTRLCPVVAHNGTVRWSIETRGRAAHSSAPENGISAIRSMCRVIEAIERDYITKLSACHPLTGPARCSINVIRGGSQINIIPDQCVIQIERRLVPGECAESVRGDVEKILDRLRKKRGDLTVIQHAAQSDAPLAQSLESPFLSGVAATLKRLGFSAEFRGAPYCTNASTYLEAGIPSVVLGPGNIGQAHQADEFIHVDEFRWSILVYEEIMAAELAQGQGG